MYVSSLFQETIYHLNFKTCNLVIKLYEITLILSCLAALSYIPTFVPFVQSYCQDCVQIIIYVKTLKDNNPQINQRLNTMFLIQEVNFITGKTLLMLYLGNAQINVTIIFLLLLSYCLLKIIIFLYEKTEDECSSSLKIVLLFCQIIAVVFVTQIVLKQSNSSLLYGWGWGDIFWPYWMLTGILSISSLPLFYTYLSKMITITSEEMTEEVKTDYIGLGWALCYLLGFIAYLYLYGIGMLYILCVESSNVMKITLMIACAYIMLTTLYSVYYRVILDSFITQFKVERPPEQDQQKQTRKARSIFTRISIENLTNPTFFTKRSQAYYAETVQTNKTDETPTKKPTKKANDETDTNVCICCFDRGSGCIYMPCKHGGLCYECATKLWKQFKCCHICREKIDSILEVDKENKPKLYKVVAMTVLNRPKVQKQLPQQPQVQ